MDRMDRKEAIEILKKNAPKNDPRLCALELCSAIHVVTEALQEPELDIDRMVLLLEKCVELFKRQDESPYILNLLGETVYYDDVECDGYCLMEDIEAVLVDVRGEEE